jgi:hypothetical protein
VILAYARGHQSTVPEALSFLGRERKPQAIVKRTSSEFPEYGHRVQAGVRIGCGQSLQRPPEDNSTNEIGAPQHLAKFFDSELFRGAIDAGGIQDGDIGS